MVAEAAAASSSGGAAAPGIGLVLDARSGSLKQVDSLASLSLSERAQSEWTPTGDKTQLPELRHNLQLIFSSTKADVEALVKEGQAVRMRREWARREVEKLQADQVRKAAKWKRLGEVKAVVAQVAKQITRIDQRSLNPVAELKPELDRLVNEFRDEYVEYDLDEAVVGALAHVVSSKFYLAV